MTQIELLKQQTTTTNEGAHSTLDGFAPSDPVLDSWRSQKKIIDVAEVN